jgi:hypothetical protein
MPSKSISVRRLNKMTSTEIKRKIIRIENSQEFEIQIKNEIKQAMEDKHVKFENTDQVHVSPTINGLLIYIPNEDDLSYIRKQGVKLINNEKRIESIKFSKLLKWNENGLSKLMLLKNGVDKFMSERSDIQKGIKRLKFEEERELRVNTIYKYADRYLKFYCSALLLSLSEKPSFELYSMLFGELNFTSYIYLMGNSECETWYKSMSQRELLRKIQFKSLKNEHTMTFVKYFGYNRDIRQMMNGNSVYIGEMIQERGNNSRVRTINKQRLNYDDIMNRFENIEIKEDGVGDDKKVNLSNVNNNEKKVSWSQMKNDESESDDMDF